MYKITSYAWHKCSFYIVLPQTVIYTFLGSEGFPPQSREDSISPVIGCHVETAKHLGCCDGFGVHPHLSVRLTTV